MHKTKVLTNFDATVSLLKVLIPSPADPTRLIKLMSQVMLVRHPNSSRSQFLRGAYHI